MAEILEFPGFSWEEELEDMERAELLACLEDVRRHIARLDEQEPADMNSEAYELWGERHEELEDLADEIQDLLDCR